MANRTQHYANLLKNIQSRIRQAQTKAIVAANREMLALYWDIGRLLVAEQEKHGWGAGVLKRLAADIRRKIPEMKGFSERNLKRMTQFYRGYPALFLIGPPAVAQLPPPKSSKRKDPLAAAQLSGQESVSDKTHHLVAQLPWAHNIVLLQKVKNLPTRLWYMKAALSEGWSRNVLTLMIEATAHKRQGRTITNFDAQLPPLQSDLAQQTLKDPYIFNFLTIDEPFRERELETELVRHIEHFLLELGQGFAFVGRQYHLGLGGDDFYIDLLFYHLKLRRFVVIDLKSGEFKPEYTGKMNFYLSAVDDCLRHPDDKPSIGLILCKSHDRIIVEYALRDIRKPVGVARWQTKLVRALPKAYKGTLPTVEQIEAELRAEEEE